MSREKGARVLAAPLSPGDMTLGSGPAYSQLRAAPFPLVALWSREETNGQLSSYPHQTIFCLSVALLPDVDLFHPSLDLKIFAGTDLSIFSS